MSQDPSRRLHACCFGYGYSQPDVAPSSAGTSWLTWSQLRWLVVAVALAVGRHRQAPGVAGPEPAVVRDHVHVEPFARAGRVALIFALLDGALHVGPRVVRDDCIIGSAPALPAPSNAAPHAATHLIWDGRTTCAFLDEPIAHLEVTRPTLMTIDELIHMVITISPTSLSGRSPVKDLHVASPNRVGAAALLDLVNLAIAIAPAEDPAPVTMRIVVPAEVPAVRGALVLLERIDVD